MDHGSCRVRIILVCVLLAMSTMLFAQTADQQSPNVVIILADDLGYGDISSYNEDAAFQTPHIDGLAKHGVRFTDAHTSSSVCTPTRYGILTGRYNWRSTLKSSVTWGFSKALIQTDRLTIADVFKQNNYHTAFMGKWHLGWDWHFMGDVPEHLDNPTVRPEVDFSKPVTNGPGALGFTYSYGIPASLDMPPYVYVENGQPTTIPTDTTVNYDYKGFWRKGATGSDFAHADVLPHLTRKTVEYINQQSTNNDPFFLYFALPAPHTPILPTTEYIGQSNANLYGDFILQVDGVVRQVKEALEQNGMLDNTMLVFASDNGSSPRADFEELAEAGHDPSYIYRGYKADIYEGGHRVPFIVSWPDQIEEGFTSGETISTVDFMATAADLLGKNLPDDAGEDSYSLLPILQQKAYKKPLREATVFHSIDGRFAIRKGKWKLILWPGSGGWSAPNSKEELEGLPAFQLYNLELDPSEEKNLMALYPEKVKALKSLLETYIKNGRSTPGTPQQNDGAKRWDQLDWIDL